MNTAIIVAAGSGSRIDSARPKQFLEILGKPVLIHTLETFDRCRAVNEVVVVLPASEVESFETMRAAYGLQKVINAVAGGSCRAESVAKGFHGVSAESEIVLVHDGARPLVSIKEIEDTISAAREHGSACLVAPVTDTIKEVDAGRIVQTIDRSRLRRALTPQAFRYSILREALSDSPLDETITDESLLAERLGYEVAAIEGSSSNIKITHREDLQLAEAFLSRDRSNE